MEFQKKDESGVTVARVAGYIDTSEITAFSSSLLQLIQEGGDKILLDLSGVNYLGSAGLRLLMIAHQEAVKKGANFILCSAKKEIMDLIHIVHFEQCLAIYATKTEALQAFTNPA